MTKENNSNINKLNVNLRQTKSAQQTNILGLSMAEIGLEAIADQAERLRKEVLDQPRKEAERVREICEKQFSDQFSGREIYEKQLSDQAKERERAVKHLADQITGRGIMANHLADRESELKRQIEISVKQLMGIIPRDIELKESLYKKLSVAQAFGAFADVNKSFFELNKHFWTSHSKQQAKLGKDFYRARRLLAFADEFDEIDITEGLTTLENELQTDGALTSRQLFFLIAQSKIPDFIPRMQKGLKLARVTAAKNKKERAEKYHADWRKWAGETLKANPTWNQDKIAKFVLETATAQGHKMANGNLYKFGTVFKVITGNRKAQN